MRKFNLEYNFFFIYRKVLCIWILFFGSTEAARNYSCRISIKNKFGYEFNYSGPVHTLDKSERAIVNSGFLLSIGSSAAKKLVNKENDLKLQVIIQDRKSEAVSMEIQNRKSKAISMESKDLYEPDSDSSLEPDSFYADDLSDSE